MKRGAITALVALLACGAAQASEWVHVDTVQKDGTKVLVDTASVIVTEYDRRAWLKGVLKPHSRKGTGSEPHKWVDYELMHVAFDCSKGTAMTDAITIYYIDSTNFAVPDYLVDEQWRPVAPDTVMEAAMKFVCAWEPTSKAATPTPQTVDPPAVAATPIKTVRMPNCGEDYYPAQALRLNQQGSVVVKFCIGTNNKIDGAVEVVTSSGFPLLDNAAGQCVGAGGYKAAIVNGVPARTCKEFRVNFAPLTGR